MPSLSSLPIKTKKFELADPYKGFEFTAQTNVSLGLIEKMQSAEVTNIIDALCQVVQEWNFEDLNGEGELIPLDPKTHEHMGRVPTDLLREMVTILSTHLGSLPS